METGCTPEMLVPMDEYCARLRGLILEKKMILDFVRTLARKEHVILWGDKRFLKLHKSYIDRGAESAEKIEGLKTCYCALTLCKFFPYYVPACAGNIQIKLPLLLVIIQDLTLGSRGFLCKLRVVQVSKKLVAYYAIRTIITIFTETIHYSPS
jgi:hypothetical protein